MTIFLTIILIFILIFWLIGKFWPVLLMRWVSKRTGTYQQGERGQKRDKGDVFVSGKGNGDKIVDKEMGEYVDFEEVDDTK